MTEQFNESWDSKAWNNKGKALGNLGKPDEAIKAYDKAIETNPQNSKALYKKDSIYSN